MKTTKIPYDYQLECVSAVLAHFAAGNRAVMYVMATGLGKTFTLGLILRQMYEIGSIGKVCIALDKGTPLPQIRDELLEVLEELGITINVVTPKSKPEEWNCDIVITTLQLLHSRRSTLSRKMFDLLVVDEAHHAKARTFCAAIEHFDCDRLAFTGTPERSDGLDITEMFGKPVYNLPLEEAIRRKLGADMEYIVYSDNIDMRKLREYAKRVQEGDRTVTRRQLNDTLFLPTLYEEVVKIVRERSKKREKTIVFCNSRAHVNKTLEHFDGAKPFHSMVPSGERNTTLAEFSDGNLAEVIAINMLNEAVDFPDAQHLVLLRSTDWVGLWKQQIGRGYRGRGKKVVVHDFAANIERILAVRELGLEVTHRGTGEGLEKPEALVIDGFSVEFSSEVVEILGLLDQLGREFYDYDGASAAAKALGAVSQSSYLALYRSDPRLPAHPAEVYKGKGWKGWHHFLGKGFYPTYAEASAAAQALGKKLVSRGYRALCKMDSRLPSDPHRVYKGKGWKGWHSFLRGGFYPTYAEASAAAQALGIAGQIEYKTSYKKDARLHSRPHCLYKGKGWESWPHFLGTGPYATHDEASAATRVLSITSSSDYAVRYKEDRRLPRNPDRIYKGKGWKSWPHFLRGEQRREIYATYAEASAAAQRLMLATWRHYCAGYTRDLCLPSNPAKVYASEWVGWPHFLGRVVEK